MLRIVTERGTITLPGENLLYLSCGYDCDADVRSVSGELIPVKDEIKVKGISAAWKCVSNDELSYIISLISGESFTASYFDPIKGEETINKLRLIKSEIRQMSKDRYELRAEFSRA